LASIYRLENQFEKAEAMYKESMKIYESTAGVNSTLYSAGRNNLGLLYLGWKKYDLAEKEFEAARESIKDQVDNIEDQTTGFINLGALYVETGKYEKAEEYLKKACLNYENTLGTRNQHYQLALNSLAIALAKQGKLDEADIAFEKALQEIEKMFGKNHPTYKSVKDAKELFLKW
ncbi:MAG: tetratricopeptide repeat protein, partial [Bacillota bacterium]|nr:tetratricopeptide repeat protein [Bacillota bacterium]